MNAAEILDRLKALGDETIARHSQRFFKTGEGEYGYGDIFLGIRVPVLRSEVKKHKELSLETLSTLLRSALHEVRLFALIALVEKFAKATAIEQEEIFNLYLSHTKFINNWDLVDTSAPQIVGASLFDKDRSQLLTLAKSSLLWERRIAIVATFYFIRRQEFRETLEIATLLLDDKEDLMHKATGWMLREVGKQDRSVLEHYLKIWYQKMPRTMLRYAIEKFTPQERKAYLEGSV